MTYLNHLIDITLETAPWMLVGLLAAGLIKAWIPENLVVRWLGGQGIMSVVRATLVGMPLPLCSCSVIPMALELRRNGASNASTVSFLVSTPETGVDSIALSWVLLGPFMTVARPVAAMMTGIFSGFLTLFVDHLKNVKEQDENNAQEGGAGDASCYPSRCGCKKIEKQAEGILVWRNVWQRTWDGLWYALEALWNDIAPWLTLGLLLTALVETWLPVGALQDYSHEGWFSMLIMVFVSMPVYVCATASTPMAASMLYSGLSPGMTLAFLISGPATNLAPLGIIKRELGGYTLTAYLLGILISAMSLGMLTDWIAQFWHFNRIFTLTADSEMFVPSWLAIASAFFLTALSMRTILLKWGRWRIFRPTMES